MPGLIIDGKEELIEGLNIVNYFDEPKLKLKAGEDMRHRRTRWIRSFTWHNTKNIPTTVKSGAGASTNLDYRIARLWATDGRHAGAHLSVDWDGQIGCHADLLRDAAYHAGSLNEVSIGAELFENSKGVLYQHQLDVAVKLTIWMCRRFGIQMQMPVIGCGLIPRIQAGGKDCVGVFGHCHQKPTKPSDPGDHIFEALRDKGFREIDFIHRNDKAYWRKVQLNFGLDIDGVPGLATCDALREKGFAHGLYTWTGPDEK